MASGSVVDAKRNLMDIVTFNIPGHDCCRMTVSEIISKLNKDRIENIDEAVHTLIAVWTAVATVPENLTNAVNIFHSLFRETSLTILSGRWIRVTSSQKRQMAKVLTKSSQVFGPLVDKAARLCTVLVMAVYDPWGEPALNQLIEGQIDYSDATGNNSNPTEHQRRQH
ncbi:uncharacterized protein LOC111637822 [Centruroides sculpturatus]|uniref:uncharacterized protein LOC111637822 n=1 Tax=Centruroides sculpturatus TaxID=218467 RepID=UPI000C6D04E4|nr:uncharacterized protein LOC111637822 [Centruroides sculpturatus]